MPDSEDNIYYKISRMIKDEFDAFRKEIKADIREATNDYKQLWQRTEEQEGRLNAVEKFQNKYEPLMDKVDRKIYTISIIVPVIITLVGGIIFAYIQRGVIG